MQMVDLDEPNVIHTLHLWNCRLERGLKELHVTCLGDHSGLVG